MTIDFALSLSPEGIELLHRVQRGWRRIGQADVASPTLAADLARMRDTASAIAPDALWTKLIIPADQIRYTAIDSTMTTLEDIHAALEGKTPYALDELVIDFERFGGRTHIAAVARETLQEAESFAKAHAFNPVAFVAVPEPFTFQKEVFFGPTVMMPALWGPQARVERDSLPVMIVGTRLKSRLLVFDLPDDLATPEDDLLDVLPKRPVVPDIVAAKPEQRLWVDLTVPEYHAPRIPALPVQAPPPVVRLAKAAPVPANPVLLDPIIAETHAAKAVTAPEKIAPIPPKVRVAAPAPRPQAAPAPRRLPLIAAGIAFVAVATGGLIWSQQGTGSAPPDPVSLTVPADTTLAGPDTPLLDVPDFGLSDSLGTDLPAVAAIAPQPQTTTPEPLVAGPRDALPEVAPPAPASLQTADAGPLGQVLSPAEAARIYEATGVWLRAPRFFDIPQPDQATADLTRPQPGPPPARIAQPAALSAAALLPDPGFVAPPDPPSPTSAFVFDANGFVVATAEGTMTPEGALVIAGLPDLAVTLRPQDAAVAPVETELPAPAPQAEAVPDGVIVIAGAPDVIPPLRPEDAALPEPAQTEDAAQEAPALGSVGVAGLVLQNDGTVDRTAIPAVRPLPRPEGLAPATDATPDITAIIAGIDAEDATVRFQGSSALAVTTSQRPAARPGNFAQIVASAQAQTAPTPPPAAASTAAIIPDEPDDTQVDIQPQNTTPLEGGVARAATQDDVIRLRQINLIGVYGRPNDRRALVRLSNGRFVRVEVGSELDGGQVTAIGENALNYVKRGQTYAIEIPSG